jgi:energy-converting hydrogenase Eha subunit A
MINFFIRYPTLLFALIMSMITSIVVSACMTWLHLQNLQPFLRSWLYSFLVAWPLVFLCILIFAGYVRSLVQRLCAKP